MKSQTLKIGAIVLVSIILVLGGWWFMNRKASDTNSQPAVVTGHTLTVNNLPEINGRLTQVISTVFGSFPNIQSAPYQVVVKDLYGTKIGGQDFAVGFVYLRYRDGDVVWSDMVPPNNIVYIYKGVLYAPSDYNLIYYPFDTVRSRRDLMKTYTSQVAVNLTDYISVRHGGSNAPQERIFAYISFDQNDVPVSASTEDLDGRKTSDQAFVKYPDLVLYELPEAQGNTVPSGQAAVTPDSYVRGIAGTPTLLTSEAGYQISYPSTIDGKQVLVSERDTSGRYSVRFYTSTSGQEATDPSDEAVMYCSDRFNKSPVNVPPLREQFQLASSTQPIIFIAYPDSSSGSDYIGFSTSFSDCTLYSHGRFRADMFKFGTL